MKSGADRIRAPFPFPVKVGWPAPSLALTCIPALEAGEIRQINAVVAVQVKGRATGAKTAPRPGQAVCEAIEILQINVPITVGVSRAVGRDGSGHAGKAMRYAEVGNERRAVVRYDEGHQRVGRVQRIIDKDVVGRAGRAGRHGVAEGA